MKNRGMIYASGGLGVFGFLLVAGFLNPFPPLCIGGNVFGLCIGYSFSYNFYVGIILIVIAAAFYLKGRKRR